MIKLDNSIDVLVTQQALPFFISGALEPNTDLICPLFLDITNHQISILVLKAGPRSALPLIPVPKNYSEQEQIDLLSARFHTKITLRKTLAKSQFIPPRSVTILLREHPAQIKVTFMHVSPESQIHWPEQTPVDKIPVIMAMNDQVNDPMLRQALALISAETFSI